MQIVIQKNKEYAFQSFFRRLKIERKLNMLDNLEIPQDLINRAGPLLGIKKDELNDVQKEVRNEAEQLFERLWLLKQSEIDNVLNLLVATTKYHYWLIKKIPDYTGLAWPCEKIFIYPNIHSWAAKVGPYISIGIAPPSFLEKDLIPVIIHEFIHVNTDLLKFDNLKFSRDSSEIANTLETGRITRAMNEKFGILMRNLRLAVPFRKYDEDWKYLKSLAKDINNFEAVATNVDHFLISKNHEEVYKK